MDNLINTTEFGPFTPQELERIVAWLQSEKLVFEILKDQAAENAYKMNDGQNIVNQLEFRTETYLAQIFTVRVENLSAEQIQQINTRFKLVELVPERFRQIEKVIELETESSVKRRLDKAAWQKRKWAIVLILFLVGPVIFTWIKNLFFK